MSISHTPDHHDAPPPPQQSPGPGRWTLFRQLLAGVLGTWSPPRWPRHLAAALRRHWKKLVLVGGVIGVISVVTNVALGFFAARPHPDAARVTLTPPTAPIEPKENQPLAPPSPLDLVFDRSVAPLERIGKPAATGVALVPSLEGEWTWHDDHTLRFQPTRPWPVGFDGTVRMTQALVPAHVLLDRDEVTFSAPAFDARFETPRFDEDVRDPRLHRVVATLVFSHPVDDASLRKHLDATLQLVDGRSPIAHELELAPNGFRAYLRTVNIPIPRRDGTVIVTLKSGAASTWGGQPLARAVSLQVNVPGQGTFFRVTGTRVDFVQNERHEPERVLFVSFSAGVDVAEVDKALEVVLLPEHRPAEPGVQRVARYHWSSTDEVTSTALAAGTRLKPERMPVESPTRDAHAYRIDAPAQRQLWVRVKAGASSLGGYLLADDSKGLHELTSPPRTVEIMSSGALLTMSGERKLPLMSRGIEVIDARVARFLPGTLHHLLSQSRGRFEDPRFFNGRFNENNLATVLHQQVPAAAPGDLKTAYSSLDLGPLFEGARRGLFLVEVKERPVKAKPARQPAGDDDAFDSSEVGGELYRDCEDCDDGASGEGCGGGGYGYDVYDGDNGDGGMRGKQRDRRLLLLTDLGVLQKRSVDGSLDVFVQNLHAGTPVDGARVTVLAINGTSVMDRTTDATGHVAFPKLTDLPPERQPIAVVVEKGDDLSFLPWDRRDRVVSTNRFDVGGAMTLSARGLEGTLFSDRGLYRPAEGIHIGGVVKNGGWSMPVAGVPLELVFTNPAGSEIDRARIKLKANGFFDEKFSTTELSPTGSYTATLFTVKDGRRQSQLAETSVRVEEFEPDRMKIRATLSDTRVDGWVAPAELKGVVHMENLFGTPAEGRDVEGTLDVYPSSPQFARYPEWTFSDQTQQRRHVSESLGSTRTDRNGDASFAFDLARFAAGMYRLTFTAEGHDVGGGRAVIARTGAFVSPLASLVGSKADGPLALIPAGAPRRLDLLAINPQMEKVARDDLVAELTELKYLSTLIRRPDGTYAYESRAQDLPRGSTPLHIATKGAAFTLDTKAPGDFTLTIKDKADGTVLHSVSYSVSGVTELAGNLEKNAELDVRLDRADYRVGEPIRVRVVGPYVGAGLITIERERVFAHKWFRATQPSFEETIEVPAGLEGNAYVHISYLRDPAAPEVFTSPLSTGIVPFSIARGERTVGLKLTSPTRVQPGDTFKVHVDADQATDVVVFGVDEGILQLARYQAPDPLGYFLRRRALQVETSEILDLLMPEYSVYRRALAPGGDGGEAALGKNLNPFKRKTDKPAVFWSGIVAVDAKGKDISVTVPETFDGNLKIMAVAVNEKAIGAAQAQTLVRGNFVLSPSAPLFLAPGDEAVITVGITNLVDGSGKQLPVKLELDTKGGVEIIGPLGDSVAIDEGLEVVVKFRVRAKPAPGAASVVMKASGKGKSSKRAIELSVRPASPYQVVVQAGAVKGGTKRVSLARTLFDDYRKLDVTASKLPLAMAGGLDVYLSSYPYGCTEQLLSRAAPALLARSQPELSKSLSTGSAAWTNALAVVAARQQASGAIGLWSDLGEAPPFVTLYAMHMMLEGQDHGLTVPSGTLARMTRFVEEKLHPDAVEPFSAHDTAYALYLLARQGRARGADMDRLKKQLDGHADKSWRKELTGIYLASAWRLAKGDDQARELLSGSKLFDTIVPSNDDFYNQSVRDAQLLYLLSKHFPEALRYVNAGDVASLVSDLGAHRLSSLTAGYALLALDAYVKAPGEQPGTSLAIAEVMGDQASPLRLEGGLVQRARFSDDASALDVTVAGALPAFYSVVEAGFDRTPPTDRVANGIEIVRELRTGPNQPVSKVALGDVVEVVLKVRSLSNSRPRVAVVDLLPAGFQIEMDRAADRRGQDQARAGGSLRVESTDVREDRIVIYARPTENAQEYVYRVRAVSPGAFQQPPAFVQGMYDPAVVGRSPASRVEVQ